VIVAIAGLALDFVAILLISLPAPREADSSETGGDGASGNLTSGWIIRLSADQLCPKQARNDVVGTDC